MAPQESVHKRGQEINLITFGEILSYQNGILEAVG